MAKKEKGIRLSPKYGLNPSMIVCTLCGKETGALALLGKIGKGKEDKEAPKHICDGSICDDCKKSLEDNKERLFINFESGKYVRLPDEALSKDYLERVKDIRYIPLPPDNFQLVEEMLRGVKTLEEE